MIKWEQFKKLEPLWVDFTNSSTETWSLTVWEAMLTQHEVQQESSKHHSQHFSILSLNTFYKRLEMASCSSGNIEGVLIREKIAGGHMMPKYSRESWEKLILL